LLNRAAETHFLSHHRFPISTVAVLAVMEKHFRWNSHACGIIAPMNHI
jgi:hypothetical protein